MATQPRITIDLAARIEELFARAPESLRDAGEAFQVFDALKLALNEGRVRAAEPSADGWKVNAWVKKGILLGFRIGRVVAFDDNLFTFSDKHTFPPQRISPDQRVRIVPGGTSIRDGAYLAPGVTVMPPSYVNVGAYVGEDTMIDSHVLVGSCAQIGRRVHLSAGAQIGGVLEPVGSLPVIIEDDVLVGGNSGIYEGTIVKRRAVLGTGTILNRSTAVYDTVRGEVYAGTEEKPLEIPEEAVVVSGARPISSGIGKEWGLSVYAPVIIKYRDAKTESKAQLEELLRSR
ncbi:MAG: 2,3,4,5-tetrahydropyridine-2,6-dicarboxylate N-succinyltransferase [Candidatus Acidiferrales bacterium]